MVRGGGLVGFSVALLAVRELAIAFVVRRIVLVERAKTLFLGITVAVVAITLTVEAATVGLLGVHLPPMTCRTAGKGRDKLLKSAMGPLSGEEIEVRRPKSVAGANVRLGLGEI